jgi:hypothetical protein
MRCVWHMARVGSLWGSHRRISGPLLMHSASLRSPLTGRDENTSTLCSNEPGGHKPPHYGKEARVDGGAALCRRMTM